LLETFETRNRKHRRVSAKSAGYHLYTPTRYLNFGRERKKKRERGKGRNNMAKAVNF